MTKSEWRVHLKERLQAFVHSADFASAQTAWIEGVVKFLQPQTGRWSAFCAHQSEPPMQAVVARCPHLEWVFPRIAKGSQGLEWWIPGTQGFVKGPYGLSEPHPQGARSVLAQELSGFLVPGLGFDHRGYRLGRGGGFYDRALQAALKAPSFGVGFDCQLVSELPFDGHDRKLAGFISESGLKWF